MKRTLAMGLMLMLLLLTGSVFAAEPEVRGTWLTTTANDAISTPEKTAATMKTLREIGLNTVYIECWKNGYTEFPSPTMKKLIGVSMKVNDAPPDQQRDLLLEGSIEAHRQGMLAIGWFEYGFMAAYKTTNNPLRALGLKEGWLLENQAGELVGKQDGFVWMNPLHPKAEEILLNVVLDAAKQYDLDGVQLDDRISMPTEMGYDAYTKKLYAAEHNGAQPPVDSHDPAWIKWRADKITAFARRFAAAVHQVNPHLIVSASPAPYPWCYDNFACDWPVWMKWTGGETWDECVPQNYRLDFPRTKSSIEEGFKVIGDRRGSLLAGIRVVGDGPDMPAADLIKCIQYSRQQKLAGHVLWFSRGVLDVYPKQLMAFYDVADTGQAPHPARPADWRPAPVVCHRAANGEWSASITTAGNYSVIAKENGRWRVMQSNPLPAGSFSIACETASQMELLMDRR